MSDSIQRFEQRKSDHIRISLDPRSQAEGLSLLGQIKIIHEALPDFNFSEVNIDQVQFSHRFSAPFFISSMTAGHCEGEKINERLVSFATRKNLLMGVGSQRRELFDAEAAKEWKKLRNLYPQAQLVGNIGIAQLIQSSTSQIMQLIDHLEAFAFFVHLNPLQEVLQPEGTTDFRGGLQAIANLVKNSPVPVIIKEVGSGMSESTMRRLADVGVQAIDVSGLGGTHWGRVEGYRTNPEQLLYQVAQTFSNWGQSTVDSVLSAKEANVNCQIWASGGVRNGLDIAKLLALGAQNVGLAKPFLQAAIDSDDALDLLYDRLTYELKVAMFCSGIENVQQFAKKKVWQWQKN